jgi:23S rRNA (pseudouridine1915-N3)-methyltransferase
VKIVLIVIGKTSEAYFKKAEEEYLKRLKKYIKLEYITIPDIKNTKKLSNLEQKKLEGDQIISKIPVGSHLVLLDDKGMEKTSLQFSSYIEKKMIHGTRNLVFIIGGPYGFSEAIYDLAKEKISLSKLTFSHQMIRTIFFEQVYRAFTIMKNEPYHHE